mgnify:CR=1 FL=1
MEKNLTVKDKIFAFLEKKGISKTDFYAETGIESSNFKGRNKESLPGSAMLVKILTKYPDLSADWLLTGQGEMLKQDVPPVATPGIDIAHGRPSSSDKDTNNFRITQEIGQGIPYYDVDFIGGFSEIFNSQVTVPACNVVVPGFEKATLWCNVTGHSMEPKINHGDIIALRECTIDDIQYGEIYAVVLDTIRTVKILRRGSTPDVLRFVPININNFDEQEFTVNRILHIFEVLGSIARFF